MRNSISLSERAHPLIALTYPIRLVGSIFLVGVVAITLRDRPGVTSPWVWAALAAQGLLWPHVAYVIGRASQRSKVAEARNRLVEAFMLGCWAASVSLSPWPTMAIMTALNIGALSAGGILAGLASAAASALGVAVVWLGWGLQFQPTSTMLTTAISMAAIVCYSSTFGVLSHAQARRLVQARKLSDQQRVHIEETNALLEQARRDADAASLAKSRFLANMSHELRTPLNAIIGYSEMAVETLEVEEEAGELTSDLRRIGVAGKHLLNLINGVLDLSRIEAGTMQVVVEPFDVASVVREAVDTAARLVARNGNQLDVRCDDGLGSMYSDPTKLRQILINLLSNASKFTENGRVGVTASRNARDDWFTFEVSDTGRGMTPEQVAHLFQPFTVIDPEVTRRHGGTGLGLALSRRFATMMGGAIDARSTPAEGTTFTVRLPMEVPDLSSNGIYVASGQSGSWRTSAAVA